MQIFNPSNKEKELLIKLNSLIKQYGFMEVLSTLEHLASNNADFSESKHWEYIRQNLENSVIEMEEWNISSRTN